MQDRRKFIKSVSQGVILSALVGMSGFLIFRKSPDGETCNFDFICKNCKNLNSCKLPEAKEFKETNQGSKT